MCNAHNHSFNCTCGFGGEGHLGVRAPETYINNNRTGTLWNVEDSGQRLTYQTKCWFCGNYVYFYRDENGGCVLFDKLGYPWPIHSCWEIYSNRKILINNIEKHLINSGFDGRFYRSEDKIVSKPDSDETIVNIIGYVADNHALYDVIKSFYIRSHQRCTSIELVQCDIAVNNKIYPFVIPIDYAKEINDFSLLEIKGEWKKRNNKYFLLTTAVREINPGYTRKRFSRQLSTNELCIACGFNLENDTRWGINPNGKLECSICGEMRGIMKENEFLFHVSSICERLSL